MSLEAQGVTLSPSKKRGRPRKADVEAKKKRGVVGRPPGEAARIKCPSSVHQRGKGH